VCGGNLGAADGGAVLVEHAQRSRLGHELTGSRARAARRREARDQPAASVPT
jgi:hypothetical protein